MEGSCGLRETLLVCGCCCACFWLLCEYVVRFFGFYLGFCVNMWFVSLDFILAFVGICGSFVWILSLLCRRE